MQDLETFNFFQLQNFPPQVCPPLLMTSSFGRHHLLVIIMVRAMLLLSCLNPALGPTTSKFGKHGLISKSSTSSFRWAMEDFVWKKTRALRARRFLALAAGIQFAR